MSSEVSILNLILDSGTVAKFIIIVLLIFSIVSWAIMAERWRYFRRAQAQSRHFLAFFQSQREYSQVYAVASKWPCSPAAVVFREVYEKHELVFSPPGGNEDRSKEIAQDLMESVYRDLRLAAHRELARFEQRLPYWPPREACAPFSASSERCGAS